MINLIDINYLGIGHILKRKTGEIIESHQNALLVCDKVSKAYFLACEDERFGIELLDQYIHQNCNLLMVSNLKLGRIALYFSRV